MAPNDQYVLNWATRHLARAPGPARHNYGQFQPDDAGAQFCEGWRFPIIDTSAKGVDENDVTFVWLDGDTSTTEVKLIGTFPSLFEPIALEPVSFGTEQTRYRAATFSVPKGQVHRYLYLVDGKPMPDPINPQRFIADTGHVWSRFFTDSCAQPLELERWEVQLLTRLTAHILPFRTTGGQNFLSMFHMNSDRNTRDTQYADAFRLDEPIGVVNFIDKLLARQERHHLADYKICLAQMDAVLRRRHASTDPASIPKGAYEDLYAELATNQVAGWDYVRYQEPAYFLKLLRRHTYTGAFSHPRHGGNAGAAGWAYLEETYRDANGQSAFDWSRALEPPLGRNPTYRG